MESLSAYLLSFVGPFLLLALLVNRFYGQREQAARLTIALLGVYFILALVPIGGVRWPAYIHGAFGDLSITTLLLLGNALAASMMRTPPLDLAARRRIYWTLAIAALLFYPLALGLSSFDPYGLGYRPWLPGLLLLAAAVWTWFKGPRTLAVAIVVPVAAYDLRLLESPNLWDYLLDPFVAVYAWFWVLRDAGRRWRARRAVVDTAGPT